MIKQNLGLNVPQVLNLPAKKKISIGLNIRRFFTDVNGTVLSDAAAIALAPSMGVPFPFHLFGLFDWESGYRISNQIVADKNNTKLFTVFTWGTQTPFFIFNPLADINNKFTKGDVVFMYVDDYLAPTVYAFVIVNCVNGNYSSIVKQTQTTQLDENIWGAFKIFEFSEGWVHAAQLDQLWHLIHTNADSQFKTDSLSPIDFFDPDLNKQNKVVVNYEKVINQFFGLTSFIAFENSLLTLSFTIYA